MSRINQRWILLSLIVFSCGLMVGCPSDSPITYKMGKQDAKDEATLVLRNASGFGGSVLTIMLNEARVGQIVPGQRVSIKFKPRTQKNTLQVVLGSKASALRLFEAVPGGIYRFSCQGALGTEFVLEQEESEGAQITDVAVALNQQPSSIEAEDDTVTVLEGMKTTVRRSRTIQREVIIEKARVDERVFGGGLEIIKGEIRTKTELALKQHLSQSETVERTYEFDGKSPGTYKMTWVEYYREGTATVDVKGSTYTVPFKICIGAELKARKLK